MTLRDVHIALLNISCRKQNDLSMQAAMAGIKISFPNQPGIKTKAKVEFSEKSNKVAEAGIKAAMERKKSEFNRGK